MITKSNLSPLFNLVLYDLYYVDDLSEYPGFDRDSIDNLGKKYSEEEISFLVDTIYFLADQEDFDFKPLMTSLNHTNEDIHTCICKLRDSIKNI